MHAMYLLAGNCIVYAEEDVCGVNRVPVRCPDRRDSNRTSCLKRTQDRDDNSTVGMLYIHCYIECYAYVVALPFFSTLYLKFKVGIFTGFSLHDTWIFYQVPLLQPLFEVELQVSPALSFNSACAHMQTFSNMEGKKVTLLYHNLMCRQDKVMKSFHCLYH